MSWWLRSTTTSNSSAGENFAWFVAIRAGWDAPRLDHLVDACRRRRAREHRRRPGERSLRRRDPRVSVSRARRSRTRTGGSRVERVIAERVTGPEADAHIDAFNRRYHDGEAWTSTPGQERVIYRIRPQRVLRRYDG